MAEDGSVFISYSHRDRQLCYLGRSHPDANDLEKQIALMVKDATAAT